MLPGSSVLLLRASVYRTLRGNGRGHGRLRCHCKANVPLPMDMRALVEDQIPVLELVEVDVGHVDMGPSPLNLADINNAMQAC